MGTTKEELKKAIGDLIDTFIAGIGENHDNYQLRINPQDLDVKIVDGGDFLNEIAYSDDLIEQETAADDANSEEKTDYEASRLPDFYPVRTLIRKKDGKPAADHAAISRLVKKYVK